MLLRPLRSTLFPYTTLFRSERQVQFLLDRLGVGISAHRNVARERVLAGENVDVDGARTREHSFTRDIPDRKSTRLNSSHITISYAVFCLKKKKNRQIYCRHT